MHHHLYELHEALRNPALGAECSAQWEGRGVLVEQIEDDQFALEIDGIVIKPDSTPWLFREADLDAVLVYHLPSYQPGAAIWHADPLADPTDTGGSVTFYQPVDRRGV